MSKTLTKVFAPKLIAWHAVSGRSGLPWQANQDPYAVWVSEVMLQQTQVATVLERYPRFMKRFPTVEKLANAELDEVLAEWAGLGYYSRARNLHACAKQVMTEFNGQFPADPVLLAQLKGIGRSTAGAIAAFAFQVQAPILDANVKRILARLFAVEGAIQDKAVNERLWVLATDLLPVNPVDMPVYTQALMDFGATWCTARKPICLTTDKCPFIKDCQANLSGQVLLFPKKVTKAKSPEFVCNMLLIRCGNSVLLQKRPAKAIWGGLWSLPESPWEPRESAVKKVLPNPQDFFIDLLPKECSALLKKACKSVVSSSEIKHAFTHRRLWMQIYQVCINREFLLPNPELEWVPLSQLGRYGLPQPIKLFLQGLSLVHDGELRN